VWGKVCIFFAFGFIEKKLSEHSLIALDGPYVIHRQKINVIWNLKILLYACFRDKHMIFFPATLTPYQRCYICGEKVVSLEDKCFQQDYLPKQILQFYGFHGKRAIKQGPQLPGKTSFMFV